MKGFTKWLAKSLQGAIDPDRTERIGRLAAQKDGRSAAPPARNKLKTQAADATVGTDGEYR